MIIILLESDRAQCVDWELGERHLRPKEGGKTSRAISGERLTRMKNISSTDFFVNCLVARNERSDWECLDWFVDTDTGLGVGLSWWSPATPSAIGFVPGGHSRRLYKSAPTELSVRLADYLFPVSLQLRPFPRLPPDSISAESAQTLRVNCCSKFNTGESGRGILALRGESRLEANCGALKAITACAFYYFITGIFYNFFNFTIFSNL